MPSPPAVALRRFFAEPERFQGSQVFLDAEESRHLSRVLRLGAGAQVVVVDGRGRVVEARVSRAGPGGVVLEVERELDAAAESPLHLTLALALAKSEALELVIRQATEMGVSRILPFLSRYAENLPPEKTPRRLERWRKLAREALKSCQRAVLPHIAAVHDFAQVVADPAEMKLFCWETQREGGLAALLAGPRPAGVLVVIGPEGGFTSEEAALAQNAGCLAVSLGPRRLRVETAALTALALVQHAWGDLA